MRSFQEKPEANLCSFSNSWHEKVRRGGGGWHAYVTGLQTRWPTCSETGVGLLGVKVLNRTVRGRFDPTVTINWKLIGRPIRSCGTALEDTNHAFRSHGPRLSSSLLANSSALLLYPLPVSPPPTPAMAMAAPARDDEEPQDGYYSIVYELHAPGDDEWLLRHLWREAHPMAQAGGEAGAPVLGRMMAAMRRWWWRADPQLHLGRARLLLRRWRAGSASARRLARWRREGGVTPRVLLQSAEVVAARPSTGRAQGLDGLGGRYHGLDVPHPQGHRRLLRLPQHPLPIW